MDDKFSLRCLDCRAALGDAAITACPTCGGPIEVVYDLDRLRTDWRPTGRGLWRYFDLLPVRSRDSLVTLGEGDTPLLPGGRLGENLGLRGLHFKVDCISPTGSYKDRIAAVSMSRARETGKTAWAATSSGNAGASLSAYGAAAGLPGALFVLEKAPRAKIAQIMTYRPRLYAVRGLGFEPAVDIMTLDGVRDLCERRGWMLMITARRYNPVGMEGVKTLAFETCEQLGRAPDVVYVPVGGGGLLSVLWKAYQEWYALGRVDRLPRMVAAQGQGCSPVVDWWAAGRDDHPVAPCHGSISGLQLAAPPDGRLAVQALRESGGWGVAVPDEDTYRMQGELAQTAGLFVEPAAAITVAAAALDRAEGRLRGDETAVCILTGLGFKVMDAVNRLTADVEIPLIEAEAIASL